MLLLFLLISHRERSICDSTPIVNDMEKYNRSALNSTALERLSHHGLKGSQTSEFL